MRLFKKKQKYEMTNEDWILLSQILYRYVNADQNMPVMNNMSEFIRLGFAYNPTLYSIISMKANAAKGINWMVYKVTNKAKFRQYTSMTHKDLNIHKALKLKEDSLEEVEGTEINNILDDPNPMQGFRDIIEEMFIYRDTTGNSYLYGVLNPSSKKIIQLFPLPADKVRIVGGQFTDPVKGYTFDEVSKQTLPKEQVLHWKYFNPMWSPDGRALYGMSPLQAAARVINNDNMGVDSQNSAFHNEGVKGIITGKGDSNVNFTKEQGEALRKRFEHHKKLAREGKGNLAFNMAELAFLKIGETPVDLGVLDSRRFNKEVLCNVFRIHPSLLSSEASTLNNLTEARKALMTISVLPDMDGLRDKLNTLFRRYWGSEYYVDYDLMSIAELQDNLKELTTSLKDMNWITDNEKRAATDYDDYPHEAADVLYKDMGKVPIGRDVDTGFENIDEELDKVRKRMSNGHMATTK